MPSDPSSTTTHPTFPTYLLPSLAFSSRTSPSPPKQRRTSSSNSTRTNSSLASIFSSSSSSGPPTPVSSANTTPSSSPPTPNNNSSTTHYFARRISSFSSALRESLREECKDENDEEDEEERTRRSIGRAQPDTLKCLNCATDIAFAEQIVSKGFTGRHGRAYLVSPPPPLHKRGGLLGGTGKTRDLVNTTVGKAVNRQLVTGAHVVADISCKVCGTVVGWKYVDAKEAAQRYKIGKFILETKRVSRQLCWEDGGEKDFVDHFEGAAELADGNRETAEVEFDSEDEDECEEIFSGTWDRDVVAKRRAKRVGNRKRE